jgi:hypothetical protein
MATLYAATDSTILRFLSDSTQEAAYPTPPAGTVTTLTFDRAANPGLSDDIQRSGDAYKLLPGPELRKNGVVVTVTVVATNSRRQMIDDLVAMQATIQAAATVNNLKNVCQDLRRMMLTIVRTVTFPEE